MLKLIAAFIFCLLAQPVHAAYFTVDVRSILHVGVSTVISASINTAMIADNAPVATRILTSSLGCMAVGAFKEFGMDARPDYGDLFFDAVGCALGIGITEGVSVYLGKNQVGMSMQF